MNKEIIKKLKEENDKEMKEMKKELTPIVKSIVKRIKYNQFARTKFFRLLGMVTVLEKNRKIALITAKRLYQKTMLIRCDCGGFVRRY